MQVARGLRQARDEELAGLRDALRHLSEYDRCIAGDLLTALCELNEAAAREQDRRRGEGIPESPQLRRVR